MKSGRPKQQDRGRRLRASSLMLVGGNRAMLGLIVISVLWLQLYNLYVILTRILNASSGKNETATSSGTKGDTSEQVSPGDFTYKEGDFLPPAEVSKSRDRGVLKESSAHDIAIKIIYVFGGSLFGAFIVVLALVVPTWQASTNDVMTKVVPAMSSLLEVVKIIGAVFSPLLAFILGYYFSLSAKSEGS